MSNRFIAGIDFQLRRFGPLHPPHHSERAVFAATYAADPFDSDVSQRTTRSLSRVMTRTSPSCETTIPTPLGLVQQYRNIDRCLVRSPISETGFAPTSGSMSSWTRPHPADLASWLLRQSHSLRTVFPEDEAINAARRRNQSNHAEHRLLSVPFVTGSALFYQSISHIRWRALRLVRTRQLEHVKVVGCFGVRRYRIAQFRIVHRVL